MFKALRVLLAFVFLMSSAAHAWPSFNKRNRCLKFYKKQAVIAYQLESESNDHPDRTAEESRYLYGQLFSGDDMGQYNSLRYEIFENRNKEE